MHWVFFKKVLYFSFSTLMSLSFAFNPFNSSFTIQSPHFLFLTSVPHTFHVSQVFRFVLNFASQDATTCVCGSTVFRLFFPFDRPVTTRLFFFI
ncbi:hypothetical protein HanRHA438_Chr06g0248941 [Helianthus annuus]|nr:hypothetical protein HanRHA438_Chr06g0248941 [Helianthus annuus]